jgi:uncharacterized protein (DUF2126 family)
VDKCEVEFKHHMQVTRIYESPRVTLPYTDEQWARVQALGADVDKKLEAGDVRLTIGGEPTFVATADRDADGKPIWNNPTLFADERAPASYTADDARRFTQALARKLGLSTQYITPGYEDTWYYLWRERKLPVNVDPFDSKLRTCLRSSEA